ncbi:6-hydroxymethylpterin diphosphokinase MptE-like protein [Methanolobus bombayensis]|uniref:6-hydroxymethylpterin diphosphokinase MptE-like protein n=1 Tax=Methanolobus bombayensis TaxID=38023 RepID=UPI001AE8E11A|nr:6-hydroxymethylpterin diphosphokinase MptE-like protein [Methanolobus bombayensis]MBP1910022.1 putative Rossmann fold enzyme [Methanolobus bombayensis]
MDFNEWKPIYESILKDMGFSREGDEQAALILSAMLNTSNSTDVSELKVLIEEKDVLVCGNAPVLAQELDLIDSDDFVIIAADGATAVLVDKGTIPDVIVTDLDGDVEKEIIANKEGSIMVVHGHGDNIDKLNTYVPRLSRIIGSTQAEPLENVFNFGGFSDGDRCAYLAKEFGAASITLVGFDFDDENVDPIKKKKLKWARLLIENLNK